MKFDCKLCNYSTDVKFCFEKHLLSKKHKEKVNEETKNSYVIPTTFIQHSLDNEFKCQFCNNIYSSSSNLARHKNTCFEKQTLIDQFNKKINDLDEKLLNKDKEIKSKDDILKSREDLISTLRSENRNLRVMLNNAGSIVKTSVSTLNYIVKNYNEAPALDYIQDIPALHYDLTTQEFVKKLIQEYRHDKLVSYIGDLILKHYKKEDPTQQAVWNSDTARLTYIIRVMMNNQNGDWRVDKKGLNTSKYTIEPVLDYIEECLSEYLKTAKVGRRHDPTNKIMNIMNNFTDASKILQLIEDKILEEEILKYMAPHLYLVKDGDLLLEE